MRIVEILVAMNALAGIAAFLGARAAIRRLVRRRRRKEVEQAQIQSRNLDP